VILEGTNGRRLELTLVAYEFPEIEDDRWDSNWLVVRISAADDTDSWTAEDPCLLTWEVDELADWLDAVAEPPATVADLEFTEPNLMFERIEADAAACVRVWFENASCDPRFRPTTICSSISRSRRRRSAPPRRRCAHSASGFRGEVRPPERTAGRREGRPRSDSRGGRPQRLASSLPGLVVVEGVSGRIAMEVERIVEIRHLI
jgi:hypothetical protein